MPAEGLSEVVWVDQVSIYFIFQKTRQVSEPHLAEMGFNVKPVNKYVKIA